MNGLADKADVVVIGGGVIGLSVARALALRHAGRVLLIERDIPGAEASSAAAGMLAPQAEADSADDFFQLCCRSRDMYADFAEALRAESGIDIELDPTGTLYLAFTDEDQKELEHRYNWQTRAGLPVEPLQVDDARLLEPSISKDIRAALKFPLDIQVENRRLVSALALSNEKLGVRLITGTTVESLRIERGRMVGLETSRGLISTGNVVVAAGAWTMFLSPEKMSPGLRIEPVRGQMVCFESNPGVTRHVIYSRRGYLVPRRDGRLLAGSTTEQVGFDNNVTAAGIRSILYHAFEISPEISNLSLADCWAGLRPRSPDNLPVMGLAAEIGGLFYATGHYRNGILLAPITGELIAGLIIDNVVPPLLGVFAPDRFAMVTPN